MAQLLTVGLAVSFLALSVPAQATWIVDPSGAGDFTEIRSAVAAAAPGDRVLVRAGTYAPFVLDRGIQVIGGPNVEVRWTEVTFFANIMVRDLPAGQTAVVRGLASDAGFFGLSSLHVLNCAGRVHLDDLSLVTALVEDCAQVSCFGVRVAANTQVRRSTVSWSACSLGYARFAGFRGSSTAGLRCEDSRVTFAGGLCRGSIYATHASALGPGIRVLGGRVTVAGGADTSIEFGEGAVGGGNAIEVLGGELELDTGVLLLGVVHAPAPGSVVARSVPSASASLATRTLTARTRAPGAFAAFSVVGFWPGAPVPTVFGDLWFGLHHVVLSLDAVPASGDVSVTVGPMPFATVFVVQSVVAYPDGRLELSTPATLHVLP